MCRYSIHRLLTVAEVRIPKNAMHCPANSRRSGKWSNGMMGMGGGGKYARILKLDPSQEASQTRHKRRSKLGVAEDESLNCADKTLIEGIWPARLPKTCTGSCEEAWVCCAIFQ